MFGNFKQRIQNLPHKGGILGALLGALVSAKFYTPEDKPLKNAGKTTVFTGAGFLLGEWIENKFLKK
jgi:hypothetical protein